MRRRRFLVGTLALAAAVTACIAPSAAAVCQSMAIPAYFYPGPFWTQAINAAPRVSVLIMNPASGPGTVRDPAYASVVAAAQARGIKVLGYVHTSYSLRDAALVRAEVDAYRAWYGVNGIFLDEVSSGTLQLPYYQALANYIRQVPGQKVYLNPGVPPAQGYMAAGDVVVVFEGTYASYVGFRPPSWIYGYPSSRFCHLVHGTSLPNMQKALDLSQGRNVATIYVTHDVMPNPWDSLPTYWSQEVTSLQRTCR